MLPLFVVCLGMLFPAAVFAGDEWRPVTPEELAAKTPVVEKDADAEAIFWEVRVDDSLPNELSLKNYIRVKIFTERGKESQSKVDIRYVGDTRVKDIAARVIKPDGTIVELKKEDVFERTIVKDQRRKSKGEIICSLRRVEPGAIIGIDGETRPSRRQRRTTACVYSFNATFPSAQSAIS